MTRVAMAAPVRAGRSQPDLGLGLCGTGVTYILYYLLVEISCAVAASGVTYVPPVVRS